MLLCYLLREEDRRHFASIGMLYMKVVHANLHGSPPMPADLLGWRSLSQEDGHSSLGIGLQPAWQQQTLRKLNK